jgi:hypothetical protein
MTKTIGALRKEEQRLERGLSELRAMIRSSSGTRGKGVRKSPGKRKLSAKGRAAIAAAAKRRWAAYRKSKKR